jgi:HEPN domain-containing protein
MSEPERHARVDYWLGLAREDLEAARTLWADARIPSRIPAYLAQQAAEKALKAGIAAAGVEPPRTHDLDRLAQRQSAFVLQVSIDDLLALVDAHIQGRYPDDPASSYGPDEATTLIDIAAAVVATAATALAGE